MRVKPYLQLLRLPNVFTAMADVFMGYFITHLGRGYSALELGLLVASSSLLYLAGMVLNDVFDVSLDAVERPERPIPSGRISLRVAQLLGWGLLIGGLACGWGAAAASGMLRPGLVATGLAAAVVLYDAALKKTPIAPLGMGLCRFLNVLLGMSILADASDNAADWMAMHYLLSAGVGVYVVGITLFARNEATESSRLSLGAAILVMAAGLALLGLFPVLAATPGHALSPSQITTWRMLMLFLATIILWRCVRAMIDPSPRAVQTAVVQSILSLIFLDAAVIMYMNGVVIAFCVALLIIPSMALGRWIYST